jgi:hypothetical protein
MFGAALRFHFDTRRKELVIPNPIAIANKDLSDEFRMRDMVEIVIQPYQEHHAGTDQQRPLKIQFSFCQIKDPQSPTKL